MILSTGAHAYQDTNPYPFGSNPNNQFRQYWKDSSSILKEIEQFQALYVKYHGCVWSECAVDEYDDDGENRDGDENWYQYRTQEFCGNAAYSLYGIRKGHFTVNSCSRGTYINSFFTYGGADNLAEAVGKSVNVYYSGNGGSSNAECMALDGENGNNNNNNNGMSGTLGCQADGSGRFAMATFDGQTCDGKYFIETIDNMRGYNRAMNNINCERVWALSKSSSSSLQPGETLLRKSWACDMDMYPNHCPDPYGMKRRYASTLRAASNGLPVGIAVTNSRLKTPMRIISWLAILIGIGLLSVAFFARNRERIAAKGGGAKGFLFIFGVEAKRKLGEMWTRLLEWAKEKRKESKKKKKKKSSSPRSGTSSPSKRSSSRSNSRSSKSRSISPSKKQKKKRKDKKGSNKKWGTTTTSSPDSAISRSQTEFTGGSETEYTRSTGEFS